MYIPKDMLPGTIYSTKSYGNLRIIDYKRNNDVLVEFCDTGTTISLSSGNIRKGAVKDPMVPSVFGVGFYGIGPAKSRVGGVKSKSYMAWINMLKRCHCPNWLSLRPTYIGCTVCDEWHNFQVFDRWYNDNRPPNGKFDIDKDIKINGNKIYSPSTCIFVSRQENARFATQGEFSFISPDGELVNVVNLTKFCGENGLDRKAMSNVHLGKRNEYNGWTRSGFGSRGLEKIATILKK